MSATRKSNRAGSEADPKRVLPTRTDAPVECAPASVASWIGLADATLLGSEPIELPGETVARLQRSRALTELTARCAAAILRIGDFKQVLRLTNTGLRRAGVRLGHRKTTGGKVVISGADLAAFIAATATPPVPTTGIAPRADQLAADRAAAEARARHQLPTG
jgi:hypothetical protein